MQDINLDVKNKVHETIIIGAGISGLACARKLHDAGKDFIVISKDIGGRMGALDTAMLDHYIVYAPTGFKNVLKYAQKIEPIRLEHYYYLIDGKYRTIFSFKNIKLIPKMIKFLFLSRRLWHHFLKYLEQGHHKSVKEFFESNPFLLKYWKMSSKEFINKHGFEEIDELFANPIATATGFVNSEKLNAFYYLMFLFCAITETWIIDLKPLIEKIIQGYQDKIKVGTVLKVSKNKNATFKVHSSIGDFTAKNIVFAAPHKSLRDIYNLPKPHLQKPVRIFCVKGIKKDIYQNKRNIVFQPKNHDISFIWGQKNGTDIVFSRYKNPNLNKYYKEHRTLANVWWDPGMIIPKNYFIEQKLDKNVYLASDYNISTTEVCFLTGLYAANQIIKGR